MSQRTVSSVVPSQPTSDGAGVQLRRSVGSAALRNLDPFLLLDEFSSDNPGDYIAGFPDHPHRGFETVTYMIDGHMEHRDSLGNTGHLRAGSVQWMTAGRGIIHSEMPKQEQGLMRGFQLWVNLPASDKMCAPRYQDLDPDVIPSVSTPSGDVRVIAGTFRGVTGPVGGVATAPIMLDVALTANAACTVPLPRDHAAFAYVFEGSATVAGSDVPLTHLAVLSAGESITMTGGPDGARVLLLAGQPIGEPIVQYGPFVMNTDAEIRQAIADYRAGALVQD